jgi:hypothetical protein
MFSTGGALAMGGLSALSAFQGQQAQNKQNRQLKRQLRQRRRSPFGQALTQGLGQFKDIANNLPGQIRSNLLGGSQARASEQMGSLNRQLAQTGQTAGSDVYGNAQRGLLSQLNRDRSGIETGTAQLRGDLLGQLGRYARSAGEFMNPLLPTQEETYIDPTQILTSGLVGGQLFGRGGGEEEVFGYSGDPYGLLNY